MSTAHLELPIADAELSAARRQYVELFGSVAVMNTYLKIALLVLALVDGGLVLQNAKLVRDLRNVKPIVIRIDQLGRAEAVSFDALRYKPQEREIRFFLSDFVERHYSRMRATLRENYARSLYFLDGRLSSALMEANRKSQQLETFLTGTSEEADVKVTNVVIEDLRTSPYRASVDFEKVYYGAGRTVTRKEKYVANFVFVFRDEVPNEAVPINPLGLTITYFREDQAFE